MLLVDDLLTAPVKGLLWVFKEIQKAATEEQRNRRDQIMASLSSLYVALEQGQISEDDFDAREQALLDELDALDAKGDTADDEDDEDEEDEENAAELDASEVEDLDEEEAAEPPQAGAKAEYALKAIRTGTSPDIQIGEPAATDRQPRKKELPS